jgi:hypothetical protein
MDRAAESGCTSSMDAPDVLFSLLYEQWDLTQQRADAAWGNIWSDVRCYEAGSGAPPTEAQIGRTVRLEHEAGEWLVAIGRQFERARQRVQVL